MNLVLLGFGIGGALVACILIPLIMDRDKRIDVLLDEIETLERAEQLEDAVCWAKARRFREHYLEN